MATYYVSKSLDNGYIVGSDANTGATKNGGAGAGPFLTIKHAYDSVADGDVIIVNGGAVGNAQIYTETVVVSPTAHNVTAYPDPSGDTVTWRNTNIGADGWIYRAPLSKTTALGAIGSPQLIFDAQSVVSTRCVVCNQASLGITCLNVTFNNWTIEALYLQPGGSGLVSALAQNCTFNGSGSVAAGNDAINILVIATDTVTVRSCTFACGTVAKTGFNCIAVSTNAAASVLTVDHCSFTYNLNGSLTANGIQWANLPGTLNATNNSFNGSLTGTGNTWRGIYTGQTSAAVTFTSKGNQYLATTTDNNTLFAIHTVSNGVVDIENETVIWTGSGALTVLSAGNGIRRGVCTTGTSSLTIIRNNKLALINAGTPPENGIGLWIGDNSNGGPPTGQNTLNNVLVSGNSVSGANHNILIGWIGGALVWGNTCSSSDNYHIVLKNTQGASNPNLVFANLLDGRGTTLLGASVLGKSSQGDKVFNNLILRDSGTLNVAPFVVFFDGAAGAQGVAGASTNMLVANNLVYYASGIPTKLVLVQDTSTAIFHANAYYAAAGAITGSPFSYQGLTYTLAQWLAQIEPDGVNPASDPLMNYATGDYRIKPNSALYRTGIFVDARGLDYRGRPFWATPSIGPYEVAARDLVSVGTNR